MSDVTQTIKERDSQYGDYFAQASITMDLIERMMETPNWSMMDAGKKLALINIAMKQGRILNGDPEYSDNWHDIGGYAKLAEDLCKPGDEWLKRDCCDTRTNEFHLADCSTIKKMPSSLEPPPYVISEPRPVSPNDVSIVLVLVNKTTITDVRIHSLYKKVIYENIVFTRSMHCNNRYYEELRACCLTGHDEPHGIMGGGDCFPDIKAAHKTL